MSTDAARRIEYVPLASLKADPRNPKAHDLGTIDASVGRFGFIEPIIRDERTGYIVSGHGRTKTLREMHARGETVPEGVQADKDGNWLVPVGIGWASRTDSEAAAALIALNRTTELGGWVDEELLSLLDDLDDGEGGLDGVGYGEEDLDDLRERLESLGEGDPGEGSDGWDEQDRPNLNGPSLADRFGAPPFTVLNARLGEWRERKQAWIDLGIKSELGREGSLVYDSPQREFTNWYEVKNAAEKVARRVLTSQEVLDSPQAANLLSSGGTSVFDAALCELLYQWYSAAGDEVTDPWAGGSVRGIVASRMGRAYTGHELRVEQVEANEQQARDILRQGDARPVWITGDSRETLADREEGSADFVIGCPPYYDLEKYSDDEADLSNLSTEEFDQAMAETMRETARVLRDDRFAVFIVGNVRDNRGALRSMHAAMINACTSAGLTYVQDAILLTPIGSARTTSGRMFTQGRTLGRVHQEIMVFCKGDRREAAQRLGDVDLTDTLAALDEVEEDIEVGEAPSTEDFTPDLTPVERYGEVYIKREDLWSRSGASGGKSRAMFTEAEGRPGLITAGARNSAQIERGALVAQALGIPARIHTGHGADTPEIATCRAAGAEVLQAKPGRLTVIRARLREDAEEHKDWAVFPFGMESPVYLQQVAEQTANIPEEVQRVVVPYGSGMTLAGVLLGLADRDLPVLAVSVGQGSHNYLDKYAPEGWRDRVEVVEHPSDYSDPAPEVMYQGVVLDPLYEAKCIEYLRPGDLLWTVGVRTSARE